MMGRDTKHVEWARAWIALLEEQRKYVMEFHTTGLTWNPKVSQFGWPLIAKSKVNVGYSIESILFIYFGIGICSSSTPSGAESSRKSE